jgi:predicted DsbA family dithiol-disulfide isomerase
MPTAEMGISSVPTFIVANQHAVPGAQPNRDVVEGLAYLAQIESTE